MFGRIGRRLGRLFGGGGGREGGDAGCVGGDLGGAFWGHCLLFDFWCCLGREGGERGCWVAGLRVVERGEEGWRERRGGVDCGLGGRKEEEEVEEEDNVAVFWTNAKTRIDLE